MLFRANKFRLVLDVALAASVIFLPWYVPLVIAVVLSLRWRAWEVIAAGLVMDLVWLPSAPGFTMHALPLATLIGSALVAVFEPLRRKLLLGPLIR